MFGISVVYDGEDVKSQTENNATHLFPKLPPPHLPIAHLSPILKDLIDIDRGLTRQVHPLRETCG